MNTKQQSTKLPFTFTDKTKILDVMDFMEKNWDNQRLPQKFRKEFLIRANQYIRTSKFHNLTCKEQDQYNNLINFFTDPELYDLI